MKKHSYVIIALLLAFGLAFLSACNNTEPPAQLGDDSSSVSTVSGAESEEESSDEPSDDTSLTSDDTSIPEMSLEESSQAAEKSSEAVQSVEESSEPEEPVSIPPEGTPSTLVPVLEFGYGDGDYELGYGEPDEDGRREGPQGMWLNGNEILINDSLNHRLLVYCDGKLIDKVDTSKYPYTFNCAITDEYYYLVDKYGNAAYRVDRKTKKFEEMEIEGSNGEDGWSYHFIRYPKDSTIDIYGRRNDASEKRNTIIGLKVTPTPEVCTWNNLYMPPYQIADFNDERGYGWIFWDYDGQLDIDYAISPITLIEDTDKLKTYRHYVLSEEARTSAIACQHMTYDDGENGTSYYTVYTKIVKHGVIAGRCIIPSWNPCDDAETHSNEDIHNFSNFRHIVTDERDLLVVDGDETHVGIYKVVFGMDEIPFN